jgi:hypothetical protein
VELLHQFAQPVGAPPFVASYSAVLWEPLPGTGEKIVALVSVQPHDAATIGITRATYRILTQQKLRSLLGRQRGNAALGLLDECAAYMTQRQIAGLELEELKPLYQNFFSSPPMVARAYSVEQLLDAAVRSVSAFGTAEEMIEEEERQQSPRHMMRTGEFLKQLRRIFVAEGKDLVNRFDIPIHASREAPSVTIDYADGPLVVQVTSLPTTAKQSENTEREAAAKLFELDIARGLLGSNPFQPALLLNADALSDDPSPEAHRQASETRHRLIQFANFKSVEVLEAATPASAARILDQAALRRGTQPLVLAPSLIEGPVQGTRAAMPWRV